jgi:Trypsin-co-occurring domain 1
MSEILVEVVPPVSTVGDLGPRISLPERFQDRAAEIANSVADIAESLRDGLARRLRADPADSIGLNGVEVEFSVNLQSEAGVVIARASANAGFSVRLTWKPRSRASADADQLPAPSGDG